MSAVVRAASSADLPAVLALWAAAGSEPTVTDDLDALRALLERDPGALLVAVEAGVVVGSLVAAFNGWRATFYRLAVAPAHRRRGVATALLRAGEERVRGLGARRLDAIVVDTEDDALAFWAAAGYERQAARARFVRTV